MGLVICQSATQAAMRLSDWICAALREKPDLCMGLATGRTSGMAYEELVRRHHTEADLSFRKVTTFNTDEFVGLSPEDPRSSRYYMNRNLFKIADFRLEHTHVPCGDVVDLEAECRGYESLIKARGGLDLVVLGLGHNGHVGFNEPGSSAKSRTRTIKFTESTLSALSDGNRFVSLEQTPDEAITMGLATILEARHVILIATGIGKARALHRMFDCRPGSSVPASLLLKHPNLSVVVDSAAASALEQPDVDVEYI
ncbi:MAG: glucosamine-6-phosphate deaminase [Planctomycetota bacterium]